MSDSDTGGLENIGSDFAIPLCYGAATILGAATFAVGTAGTGVIWGAIAGAALGRLVCGTASNPGILGKAFQHMLSPQWDVSRADEFLESMGVADPAERTRLMQASVHFYRENGWDDSAPIPTTQQFRSELNRLLGSGGGATA